MNRPSAISWPTRCATRWLRPTSAAAQIGVVNPGGLRDELFFNQTGAEGDGVITFAEANNVLPFVNNLWTTTLTGAQFKTMLEQQWQRDASNQVPTRPYLQLGLSDNVTYTYDDTLPEGSRITSITINGAPVRPGGELPDRDVLVPDHRWRQLPDLHRRAPTPKDSGLVDRDGWISYLQGHEPVSPDFARQASKVDATAHDGADRRQPQLRRSSQAGSDEPRLTGQLLGGAVDRRRRRSAASP